MCQVCCRFANFLATSLYVWTIGLKNRKQDYVAQLATVLSHALEEAKTRIVIVGCGDWQLIENYKSTDSILFSTLCDPVNDARH